MKNEFSLQSILLLSLVRRIMVKRDLTESFFSSQEYILSVKQGNEKKWQ